MEVDPRFVQLADPDRRAGFTIVNEDAPGRALTGADFDPESLVVDRDGTFWIGEEFGPFVLHVAADGRLLDAPVEAKGLRSPDYPSTVRLPPSPRGFGGTGKPDATHTASAGPTVRRSRGFEGPRGAPRWPVTCSRCSKRAP